MSIAALIRVLRDSSRYINLALLVVVVVVASNKVVYKTEDKARKPVYCTSPQIQ